MKNDAPIRGICFDLWNTLAYTDVATSPVFAFAAAFGLDTDDDWRRKVEQAIMTRPLTGVGDAIDAMAAFAGRDPVKPWTRRELILHWGAVCNQNRLYSDTLPMLNQLRAEKTGIKLAIISNTQSFDLDVLRRDIEPFMDVVCLSCHEGILKPDSEIFHRTADRLGLPESDILMLGDRATDDMKGAIAAGMSGILLDRRGITKWAGPSITTLTDLAALI